MPSPLADDHPDNALKDRYLSRNEPGMLSCDSTNAEVDGSPFEFARYGRETDEFNS